MARNQDLMAGIRMGEIAVSFVASGAAYSPDVADDITRRALDMWHGTMASLDDFNMLDNEEDEDDDDFGPQPERELQTPHIVRFVEEWGDDHG